MKKFGEYHPVGVYRRRRGLGMSVNEQKALLKSHGIEQMYELGEADMEDIMLPFARRITGTDRPVPAVMVSPFPAVIGGAWADIFEGLKTHDQALYDLELDRFIDVKGAADAVFIYRAGRKAQLARARQMKEDAGVKGGRPSTLTKKQIKDAEADWCDAALMETTNEALGAKYGVTGSALDYRFGNRKACIAAGKPVPKERKVT